MIPGLKVETWGTPPLTFDCDLGRPPVANADFVPAPVQKMDVLGLIGRELLYGQQKLG